MLLVLAQAEPAPSGWQGTADWAVKSAATQPAFYPLLLVTVLVAVIVGFGLLVLRLKPLVLEAIKAWREEQALNRAHADERLKAIREDAVSDSQAQRELAKTQQANIVERIGDAVSRQTGEIAKLVDRSDRHGELLTRVAAKVGVGLLIVALAAGVVLAARHTVIANNECPRGCATGYHCCSRDGACCPDSTGTAVKPTTSLYADRSHNYREVYSACE